MPSNKPDELSGLMTMSKSIHQGLKIGRYHLTCLLATGGMAEVWLGRATGAEGFRKAIVVKTILPHLANDPVFLRMFVNEALLAATLDHPNIVHIFDLGQDGDRYYIAMEFILGRTMRQIHRRIRKQRKVLPTWMIARVALAVCNALEYAHQMVSDDGKPITIIHRDVTPENIMIAFTGVTKVVDFGIAKVTASAAITAVGKLKGKLAYLSPEQIDNRHTSLVDHRMDIYTLGVTLYELLCGRRPFLAATDIEQINKILTEEPIPPCQIANWVPKPLSDIVMKALSKNPDHRFQNAGQMGKSLESYLVSAGNFPTERHISSYLSKLFSDEERRLPTQINVSSSALCGSKTQKSEDKVELDLSYLLDGPDSDGSLNLENPDPAPPKKQVIPPPLPPAALSNRGDLITKEPTPTSLQNQYPTLPPNDTSAPADTAEPENLERQAEAERHAWDALVSRTSETAKSSAEALFRLASEAPPRNDDTGDESEHAPPEERFERGHMWDTYISRHSRGPDSRSSTTHSSFSTSKESGEGKKGASLSWTTKQSTEKKEASEIFEHGLSLIRDGKRPEALQAWTEAAKLDPENRKYRGNLNLLKKLLEEEKK